MRRQDELQLLLLLQQVGYLRLQSGLLLLQLVRLLRKSRAGRQPRPTSPDRLYPRGSPPRSPRDPGAALTACRVSVSSRRRLRHLAAAILFLSRRILLFSSSSGDSCGHRGRSARPSDPRPAPRPGPAPTPPPPPNPPLPPPSPAHLLDFAPSSDALPAAARRLQHGGAGISGGRGGRRNAVGVPAVLGGGDRGDEGGLHQPLQVGTGGDGRHGGHEVGAGHGQVGAEILRDTAWGGRR